MTHLAPAVFLITVLFAAGCSKQSQTANAQTNTQAILVSVVELADHLALFHEIADIHGGRDHPPRH